MPKRSLTAAQSFDLRQALQVATLDALMASRRWRPGDLVFQGGTSLHLAHGSPRFSEDLDFLIDSSLKIHSISTTVQSHLQGIGWLPAGTVLSVGKAREGHNPHAFVVTIGGPDVIGAVRVKVELWRATRSALSELKAIVAPVQLARGPGSNIQTFVPTAELSEIYADKVFALAARRYLKPRDVFDLHWMRERGLHGCTADDLRVRLATYPSETPAGWLQKAVERRIQLCAAAPTIRADLKRWLPSFWPLEQADADVMTQCAIEALDHGVKLMREIEADEEVHYEGPAP